MKASLAGVMFLAGLLPAQAQMQDRVGQALAQRLFPVLSQLDTARLPASVQTLLRERSERRAACGMDAACVVGASVWTPEQMQVLAAAPLRQGAKLPADEAPADAVQRELRGVNTILSVYGQGGTTRYAEIDGPMGAPGSERLTNDVRTAVAFNDLAWRSGEHVGGEPSIGLALALIDLNGRTDAIGFEPLDGGQNAEAFAAVRGTDWARWPYSALIVLGAGPEDADTRLSARGKLHLRVAAQRWHAGDAPFIIVSGGAVHPRMTRHVEAVEMRQALIERFNVPANAIVIDPYARHTTTNLRNATRLLIRLGAPLARDALVISDPPHIDAVADARFVRRNTDELGYQPGRVGARVEPFAITFRPARASLRVDPADPLDP